MRSDTNFYDRLGVPLDASPEEIRRAYREAALRLHPDVNVAPGATEVFLDIKDAYECLIDPDKRAVYDGKQKIDPKPPPPVKLHTIFSRPYLLRLNEAQLFYALLEMQILPTPQNVESSAPPMNLTVVLDCSTSMQGVRLDTIKAAAIELVRHLRSKDIFSLVVFNDKAEVAIPAGFRLDNTKMESRIRMLQTKGGTEIYQGLNLGFMEVRRYANPSLTNHIILITDGHTYGDEANCLELADQAASLGIGISALGIGDKWNDKFLDDLASRTGGSSSFIAQPEDIRTFLSHKFDGLSKSAVERISFDFETIPGIKLQFAFRLRPEASPLPVTSPFQLGSIPQGEQQQILLEFLVDPVAAEVHRILLLEGHFAFTIPHYSKSAYRLPVALLVPVSEVSKVDPPPQSLVEAMAKLTLYRMQERIQESLSEGKLDNAVQSLQYLATHLFAQGEGDLAQTVILEAKNIREHQQMSVNGEKRIKYGTRALVPESRQRET